jgi:hypothetical protein
MKKYDKSMHGKLGKAVKLRMSPSTIAMKFRTTMPIGNYTSEQAEQMIGGLWAIPLEVAYDVIGDYEIVCEQGIEIHYYNEDNCSKQSSYDKTINFAMKKGLSDEDILNALEWYFNK